jgi:large subunit ribosomal protein L21
MFAVIKTGGKQFRVAADEVLRIGRLGAKTGEIVTFPVMMLGGDNPVLGAPLIDGASVAAEVVDHGRGAKVIAFKKRRRKHSKRKRGYRDDFTVVRITEILTDGKKPTIAAKPKAAPKPKAEAKAAEDEDAPKPKAKAKSTAKKVAKPKGKKK